MFDRKPLSQHNDHLDSEKGGAYRYGLLQYIHRHDEGLATVIIAFNSLHACPDVMLQQVNCEV
jgi:hypothetical protein